MNAWRCALVLMLALSGAAQAANTPCSGSKGGIERCDGPLFVCRDGSISGSKRNCSASHERAVAPRLLDGQGACPCGGGVLCIGPRGGQYCLTPSGAKSYRRQ